ncbi:hypothetical protein ALC57_05632 [Trachymyrmex cornetzi]|uniref:Uncharacterized protein n=1 Tax=Trachymyrmex cornetzi TaxID=471704 RepID=A0A151JAC4_9HYME|nr:hypothetical protein ALC57_05632 [Trachymyrmex cornetzi]
MRHACHKIATASTAQKDRSEISFRLSPSFLSFLLLFSPLYIGDIRGFSSWNRVLRTRAANTWFQVACRGYRARTSPSPGGTYTFRVHPSLLPSTFFPTPHTPSPIPFRHNNRAVSQRVFNGRRLHATRPRAGPPRPLPHRIASIPSCSFSFSRPFFSSLSFSTSLFLLLTSLNASLSSSSSCIFPLS